MRKQKMKGISTCNPVDMDKEYLLYTAEYAIKKGVNHYQFIGPIHNPVKGNIDGMVFFRKYAQFNHEKDAAYVEYNLDAVNAACERLKDAGIKTYMWHHELEMPIGFSETYPEILNSDKDVEITHPLVKDFLENKIEDFFTAYPKMDGIILTLHETRIPLLKLKNQKLGKVERVQYVTKILFDTCKRLGKELIVRPFASIEEDYVMMTKAYEEISTELIIMDKWTQFDWSLTLPNNKFFHKIKKNPLLVETDIFGEYFGKGFLPIMLKDHIAEKYAYCERFSPVGYVSRIDREGYHPFSTVNEVNLWIMYAHENGKDVDGEVKDFFNSRYGEFGDTVYELMQKTEEIQKKIFYLCGYYFTELSRFPRLNHSKNHFYFEMMKDCYEIASNEWFIPHNWKRSELAFVREEKATAVRLAEEKFQKTKDLKGKVSEKDYEDLYFKFGNLYYVAKLWQALTEVFIGYAKFIETGDEGYKTVFETACKNLLLINAEGIAELGKKYYPVAIGKSMDDGRKADIVELFVDEAKKSFDAEIATTNALRKENLTDFVVCGGGNEGHKLQKEVNFSDTYVFDDGLCRIPGTNRGKAWSMVNAHGWFSYEVKVKPNAENQISILAKGTDGKLHFSAELDGEKTIVQKETDALIEIVLPYTEKSGNERIRLRIDRITGYTPFIYQIKVR